MALYEIRVHVEADDEPDLDGLVTEIVRAICPYPATDDHSCPRRWSLMTSRLTTAEAAKVTDLLNE